MNTQTQEALKMAIEFIEMHLTTNDRTFIERTATLEACKEALAQPAQEPVACHCGNPTFNTQSITHTKKKCFEQTAQEPVAWTDEYKNFLEWDKESLCDKAVCKDHEAIPLYTHPALSWQGLSDDEIKRKSWDNTQSDGFYDGAKWAEQALKEKNT